jgi:hypothetical protein
MSAALGGLPFDDGVHEIVGEHRLLPQRVQPFKDDIDGDDRAQ